MQMQTNAPLTLRFLGEPRVERAGMVQSFPPSKKTRALLAYLVLHNKRFRRDNLCELLWEVPDDPKGSLRWSLSKLRRLVDDEDKQRIIADRLQVGFEANEAAIDVVELQRWSERDLDQVDIEELKQACQSYSGKFLDGLELPNFPEFYLWCIAEREKAIQHQAALLSALVQRLDANAAIPFARNLVSLVPAEQQYHLTLVTLLTQLNRTQDAKQQVELSKRMLQDAGQTEFHDLYLALRSQSSAPISTNIDETSAAFASTAKTPTVRDTSTTTELEDAERVAPSEISIEDALIYSRRKLLGRDAEIEQLINAYMQCVARSRAKIVLVRGDPGIGKSSLMQTCTRLAQKSDAWLLHADAFESEIIRPFALWNDAYRRSSRNSVPAVLDGDENSSRDKIFAGLSANISHLANQKPVILLFDDVQWCDESSAAALHYVMRMNRNLPVFAVIAARDQELQSNQAVLQTLSGLRGEQLLQELKLGPLTQSTLQHLIQLHSSSANARELSSECGGNPLLAIELARAANSGSHSHSLTGLMQERLSRLEKSVVEVLQWAAVLEPHLELKTLKRVTGLELDVLERAIDIGEQQGVLTISERGLHFSHALVGRSIYEQISPVRRQLMHHRAAEVLEVDTALDLRLAAELAHHAEKSGDAAMAARAMVSAGRLCMRFFANEKANLLAQKGLKFAEQLNDAERICLTLELCEILWTCSPVDDWQQAAERCIALAESALDHGALPYARLGYQLASYLRWLHGDWKDAQRNSLQAERITRGGSDRDQILGMAEAAKCLAMLEKDLSHADALVMEADSLAKRKQIHLPAIATATGILRYHANDFDKAEEYLEEARTGYKASGDRLNEFLTIEYLVMIEIARRNYADAKRRCKQLLQLGQHFNDGSEGPFARAVDALCHYLISGDNALLEQPIVDLRLSDAKHRLTYILVHAALVDLQYQHSDSAIGRANEALQYSKLLHRYSEQMLAHVALALAYQQKQQQDEYELQLNAVHELDKQAITGWARQCAAQSLTEFD